jgi:hypothetical protein
MLANETGAVRTTDCSANEEKDRHGSYGFAGSAKMVRDFSASRIL